MGTWGTGIFDNDTACDWADTLEESKDLSYVEEALDKVLAVGSADLDITEAEEALAAAEVVARLQGNWGVREDYTESVDAWVKNAKLRPGHELARKAQLAIDRILTGPSDILEAWFDSKDLQTWKQTVADLRSRIHA